MPWDIPRDERNGGDRRIPFYLRITDHFAAGLVAIQVSTAALYAFYNIFNLLFFYHNIYPPKPEKTHPSYYKRFRYHY